MRTSYPVSFYFFPRYSSTLEFLEPASWQFFSIPFIIFTLLFSLPPSRNSDTGSHSRLFSPLATTVRALHFYCEKISALSSLVDSRRIGTYYTCKPTMVYTSYCLSHNIPRTRSMADTLAVCCHEIFILRTYSSIKPGRSCVLCYITENPFFYSGVYPPTSSTPSVRHDSPS